MAQQLSTRLTAATATSITPSAEGFFSTAEPRADTIEVADGAAGDSAIFMIPIPVNALVHSVRVASDDLGTGTTMKVGLYKQSASGNTFTAVDDDCFATALDVATAAVAFTEVRFSAPNIDTVNKKAWELAGLTARPSYANLFLGVSFPTETTAAGTVSAIVSFSHTGG